MPSLAELRSFVELSDLGTQRAVAERLRISRSVVSDHITALERKSGGPLFDRIDKIWYVTKKAQKAKHAAREALDAYDAAVAALAEATRPEVA